MDVAGPEGYNTMECVRACEHRISLKQLRESPSPSFSMFRSPGLPRAGSRELGINVTQAPTTLKTRGGYCDRLTSPWPEEAAARGTPWGAKLHCDTPILGSVANAPTAVYQIYKHASRVLLLILNTLIRSSLSAQPVRRKNSSEGFRIFSIHRC